MSTHRSQFNQPVHNLSSGREYWEQTGNSHNKLRLPKFLHFNNGSTDKNSFKLMKQPVAYSNQLSYDVDDLIARLNQACLTPAPAPVTADTPVTLKLFTTDQDRTAYILQNNMEVSRSIIDAIKTMAKATNAAKIQRNEAILGRLINPQVGKSKQTLDPPVIWAPPHDYHRHHTVKQTMILRDNIEPFEIEVPTCDIVRTWTKMKDYGLKNFFS